MKFIDLHVHTHYSDGTFSPSEIVVKAYQKGLCALAITDHDSISGIDEAVAVGERFGVEIISGIEFSVHYKSYTDVHLLGYLIDHRDPKLHEKLDEFTTKRDRRAAEIIKLINVRLVEEQKSILTYKEVTTGCSGAVGRPHIARLLVSKGLVRDSEEAFQRYLIPYNVAKCSFPMHEALREIKRLGGVAVLAHPTTITKDKIELRSIISDLTSMGLDGLEVFNNLCYKDEIIFLEELANRLGIITTGGSDFHGYESDNDLGTGRGALAVPYEVVEKLKDIANTRGNIL